MVVMVDEVTTALTSDEGRRARSVSRSDAAMATSDTPTIPAFTKRQILFSG